MAVYQNQVGRRNWSDGPRRSIEDKLSDVLAEIEARAEQDELRRLEQEREAEERRQRWEAMREAREPFIQAFPHTNAREWLLGVMEPERVAALIVEVVREGIAPERSIPRSSRFCNCSGC